MTERSMTQIMRQCDRLGDIFIELESAGNCAGYLGDFQCMSKSGYEMITRRGDEDLCLMLQAAKRHAVDNAVPVALVFGAYGAGLLTLNSAP